MAGSQEHWMEDGFEQEQEQDIDMDLDDDLRDICSDRHSLDQHPRSTLYTSTRCLDWDLASACPSLQEIFDEGLQQNHILNPENRNAFFPSEVDDIQHQRTLTNQDISNMRHDVVEMDTTLQSDKVPPDAYEDTDVTPAQGPVLSFECLYRIAHKKEEALTEQSQRLSSNNEEAGPSRPRLPCTAATNTLAAVDLYTPLERQARINVITTPPAQAPSQAPQARTRTNMTRTQPPISTFSFSYTFVDRPNETPSQNRSPRPKIRSHVMAQVRKGEVALGRPRPTRRPRRLSRHSLRHATQRMERDIDGTIDAVTITTGNDADAEAEKGEEEEGIVGATRLLEGVNLTSVDSTEVIGGEC